MTALHLVVFDPEADRGCPGNCQQIESLAQQAFAPASLRVATISQLSREPGAREPDVVVLRAPAARPLAELLRPLRQAWRSAAVLGAVCDVSRDAADLLESLRHGLDDFFSCPFSPLDFVTRLRRLLPDQRASNAERLALLGDLKLDMVIGESTVLLQAIARVLKVAASDATVLIGGETGVGKELFARAIHYNGARRGRPFIPINCGALPDQLLENELFGHARGAYTDAATAERGLLAEAAGGTVFLDEVDTLALTAQAKLLRFLQDHEYRPLGSSKTLTADVRVIAAANADLRELVAARRFREDLFHRLNILSVYVPPLRERATDIPLLAAHFLDRYAAQYGRGEMRLSPAALRKMLSYSWPGNVRELEGLLHRAVVVCPTPVLDAGDIELPGAEWADRGSCRGAKDVAMGEFERTYLMTLLGEHGGNVSRAAHAAGRDRRAFQRLLRKHGIDRRVFQKLA
jgi:DNA-binding NtrC family response regulator